MLDIDALAAGVVAGLPKRFECFFTKVHVFSLDVCVTCGGSPQEVLDLGDGQTIMGMRYENKPALIVKSKGIRILNSYVENTSILFLEGADGGVVRDSHLSSACLHDVPNAIKYGCGGQCQYELSRQRRLESASREAAVQRRGRPRTGSGEANPRRRLLVPSDSGQYWF